jgi:sugar phosphate isomerase/epimerase
VRLGVAGVLPADPRAIDRAAAERVRDLGFAGASVPLADPTTYGEGELRRARETLAAAGVAVAQANPRYRSLVGPDEVREEGVAALQAACRCARWLGADNLYVRPGSLSPRGPWLPHPDNTSPRTLDQLVASLRQVSRVAEGEGVTLALEGHVVSPLDTPARVREVIEAVGSDALRFNSDPVNFVGTLANAYDTAAMLDRLFAELGSLTTCAHLKDARVEDRLVLHIAECAPGEGLLDLPAFLRHFDRACPDGWVLLEHLPADAVADAKRAVDQALVVAGLAWR